MMFEHMSQRQSISNTQYYEDKFSQLESTISMLRQQLQIVSERLRKLEEKNNETFN